MLSTEQQKAVRDVARTVQNSLWSHRAQLWDEVPQSPADMVPFRVKDVITKWFRLELEEPAFIPSETGIDTFVSRLETAGLMDRAGNRIVISRNFPFEQRIFTAAHELGHYVMHPGLTYHHTRVHRVLRRDRPLDGPDRSFRRDRVELEADLFAAEFLMPSRILVSEFEARFRHPLDHSAVDEELAFYLFQGQGPGPELSTKALARRVAETTFCFGHTFPSLRERFNVSVSAMSIQLTDLGLVS